VGMTRRDEPPQIRRGPTIVRGHGTVKFWQLPPDERAAYLRGGGALQRLRAEKAARQDLVRQMHEHADRAKLRKEIER